MALQGSGPAAQQTLIDALASFRDPLAQLRASVTHAEAPTRLGRKQAPYTFADALTQVTAREEAKRKALASRKDVKKSSKLRPGVTPPHDAFRGAVQGGGSEPSAFWMVMEVHRHRLSVYIECSCRRLLHHTVTIVRLHLLNSDLNVIWQRPCMIEPANSVACRTTSATSHGRTCWSCCQHTPTPRTTLPSWCPRWGAPTMHLPQRQAALAAPPTRLQAGRRHRSVVLELQCQY